MFYVNDLLQEAKKNIFISLAIVLGTIFVVWVYNKFAGPFPISEFAIQVAGKNVPNTFNHSSLSYIFRSAAALGIVLALTYNYWLLRSKKIIFEDAKVHFDPKGEIIYLWAFGLLIFAMTLGLTVFKTGKAVKWMSYIAYIVMLYKTYKYDCFTKKEMDLAAIILIVGTIIKLVSGISWAFDWAITLICAKNVDFQKIVKVHFFVMGFVLLAAIVSSIIGFIPNIHYVYRDHVRHSYGTIHPSNLAAFLAWEFIAGAYILRKKYWQIIIPCGIFLTWLIIKITYGRLGAGVLSCFVLGYAFLFVMDSLNAFNNDRVSRFMGSITCISMPLLASLSYVLAALYNPKIKILKTIDYYLSTRLQLVHTGIKNFGFSLFGQYVPINANPAGGVFFYLDCAYTSLYLRMGLFGLLLFIGIYYFCCKKFKGDSLGLLVLIMVAVHCFVDSHVTELAFNPFSLALFAAVGGEKFLTDEEDG